MMQSGTVDIIGADEAGTLPGLFLRRCARSPQSEAYRQFDSQTGSWKSYTWQRMLTEAGRWQQGLAQEILQAGERVAIWLPNGIEWVCCDLAAQAGALVVVPLYVTDNPENVAFVLADSGARVLAIAELAHGSTGLDQRGRIWSG